MGRNHVVLAAVGWLGAAPAVASVLERPLSVEELTVGTVVAAGAGILPDIDHPGSSTARAFGPLSRALAAIIGFVSGGHRQATHSLLFALVMAAIAAAAMVSTVGFVVVMAVCSVFAVRLVGPKQARQAALVALPVGVAMAVMFAAIVDPGWWLPAAVGFGVVFHLVGDGLTPSGVPALWPSQRRYRIPLFTTGGVVERFVGGVMLVALAWLSWVNLIAPSAAAATG